MCQGNLVVICQRFAIIWPTLYCIRIRTRGGIYVKCTPLPEGVPRAKPKGTPEGGGVYLAVDPESSPNTDIMSF